MSLRRDIEGFEPNTMFSFLHGKTASVDGFKGTFKHEYHKAIYPYAHMSEDLIFIPNSNTEAYAKVRSELGDYWLIPMTDRDAEYIQIAYDMGYAAS
jgi:predicted DNA binding protein